MISPFAPAFGILRLDCGGIVHSEAFEMKEETHILNFKVKKEWIPSLKLDVELNGSKKYSENKESFPFLMNGNTTINISKNIYQLGVSAIPSKRSATPGEEITVDCSVKDYKGKPLENAEVCLIVVDESVILFANYQIKNPLSKFYPSLNHYSSSYCTNKTDICRSNIEEIVEGETDFFTFEIFLVTLTGKTVVIHPEIDGTIESLKKLIEEKEGIPPDEQRLIFSGKQLEDHHTLLYYNIVPHSKIHLVNNFFLFFISFL